MRKNLTEIGIILDPSGSMSVLERDIIGGFSSRIEQQKSKYDWNLFRLMQYAVKRRPNTHLPGGAARWMARCLGVFDCLWSIGIIDRGIAAGVPYPVHLESGNG